MEKTTLVETLKSLDASELKLLDDFMASTFYNHSTRVLQLYNLLREEHPAYAPSAIEKEVVFKKVFGKKPFNAVLLRNLVSDTLAKVELFFAVRELQLNAPLRQRLTRQGYIRKKLYTPAAHSLNESIAQHKKNRKVDSEYLHNDYLQLYNWFSISFNQQYRGNLNKLYKKKGIEDLIWKLDDYYLLEHSLLVGELVNSYRAHNKPFDVNFYVNRIEQFLSGSPSLHPVVKHRLMHCIMLLKNDANLYPAIRKEFELLAEEMDDSLKFVSLVELHGFSSRFAWKGQKYFVNQLDELVALREKLNMIVDEAGLINPIAFNNMVRIKLGGKGVKSALQFIKQYEKNLPESNREDTLKLSNAAIEIHRKNHELALGILLTIQKPFFASEIIYRRMLIACYFELRDWVALENTFETTKKYIQNNSHLLSQAIMQSLKHYIDIVYQLYKFNMSKKASHKQKAEALMRQDIFILDEEWIREQLKLG